MKALKNNLFQQPVYISGMYACSVLHRRSSSTTRLSSQQFASCSSSMLVRSYLALGSSFLIYCCTASSCRYNIGKDREQKRKLNPVLTADYLAGLLAGVSIPSQLFAMMWLGYEILRKSQEGDAGRKEGEIYYD